MEEPKQGEEKEEIKTLAKNTYYSFLLHYMEFFFAFLDAFLIARLVSPRLWGFLIIATSFITIITIIVDFLPPGQNYALNYYIPRYRTLNENTKLKSLIKNAVMLKVLVVIPIFFISLIAFVLFADVFSLSLEEKVILIFILSPLIFINGLSTIYRSIFQGLGKFKISFFLALIRRVVYAVPLLYWAIFAFEVSAEEIASMNLLSAVVTFIIACTILILTYLKIKPQGEKGESFKEDFQKMYKYGTVLGISTILERFLTEVQIQAVGVFETPETVTGFKLAQHYQDVGYYSTKSFYFPLMTSFSRLDEKKDYEQINRIYGITVKFTLFLLLILSGAQFFLSQFALIRIFGFDYAVYTPLFRLITIASAFTILTALVSPLLNSQNKGKYSLLINVLSISFIIPMFLFGLIFFGIEGAIIFGLIIGNIYSFIIRSIISAKIGKNRLNVKKIILLYMSFFIPLLITLFLESLMFSQLSYDIMKALKVPLFRYFDFLSLGTFLVLFLVMNIVFKTVTTKDIEFFETLLDDKRFYNRIIIKCLRLLKKLKIFRE